MSVPIIESLTTTEPLSELFTDASVLRAMLEFEVALARAESKLGVIPVGAADAIAAAADPAAFEVEALSRDALRAGTPSIPLVKRLTALVRSRDEAAAGFVHLGATSQDVSDTALILLLQCAQRLIEADLTRVEQALITFSEKHSNTVMLGRTLLQPALPITLGLKAAGWFGAIRRNHERLSQTFAEALTLQFGGAAGTLAALEDLGVGVAERLPVELGIACPDAPWHTHRDRLAALVCACGVTAGSLGKIARDISLLMQAEVAEAAEPESHGRGGSSTMPHKRNPIGCAVTIAAANRVPGLVSTYLSSMVQEQERSLGGVQAEWSTIAAVSQATGLAAASIAEIVEGLTVDTDRMQQNIDSTQGTIYAERAMILLAPAIGRDRAHLLLEEAARLAVTQ